MREIKIFLVVVVFTALVYWGVEPYAHSVMKPHVAPANFDFAVEDTTFAKGIVEAKELALKDAQASGDAKRIESANKELEKAKEELSKVETLWADVVKIDFAKGDAKKGKEFFENNCFACHGVKEDGIAANITDSSMGVIPPDLSAAGAIFDEKFLAALIMHPALALKVDHKFGDAFIMTAYNKDTSGESEEATNANIANVIAYLKDVSVKFEANEDATIKKDVEAKYAK
ncbi:cytochrome c, partial [Campylobacter jejuni]